MAFSNWMYAIFVAPTRKNFPMSVLIIEDEPKVAAFIEKGLNELGFYTSVAFNGTEGLEKAKKNPFEVILLDVNLPDVNGFEICQAVRDQGLDVRILMLTAFGSLQDKVNGFDAGADDYLVKPFEFAELVARIKALKKRGSLDKKHHTILKAKDLEMDLHLKKVTRSGNSVDLTAKEFQLLEYLMLNKGRVVSKAEIARTVWDIHFETGTNVIEVYINFLRKKIDKNYDDKLLQTKVGMGYVLNDV